MARSEEWRPVVGHEGWYEVSDLGRIRRSRAGKHTYVGRVLRLSINNSGYPCVDLREDGKRHGLLVHRLVAAAFIGPCPYKHVVHHLDGNKLNSHISNLRNVSCSDNVKAGFDSGRESQRGEKNGSAKLTEEDVHRARRLLSFGAKQADVGKELGVSQTHIWRIAHGKIWGWLKEEASCV